MSDKTWKNNILIKSDKTARHTAIPVLRYAKPVHNLLMLNKMNTSEIDFSDSSISADKINRMRDYLINTDLICRILEKKDCDNWYIRYKYNGYSIYPSSTGVILTDHDRRDEVLYDLYKKGIVVLLDDALMELEGGKTVLYGWNIRFMYKGQCFSWKSDNEIVLSSSDNDVLITKEELIDNNLPIEGIINKLDDHIVQSSVSAQ